MINYTTTGDRLLSRGINQHSTKDGVGEGFCEDMLNVDIDKDAITKRKGYETFSGDIPLRVESISAVNSGDTDVVTVTLPSYVDLTDIPEGPVRLAGYYPDSDTYVDVRGNTFSKLGATTLTAGGTSETVSATVTGISTLDVLLELNTGSDIILTDEFTIDSSTYAATMEYSSDEDVDVYISKYTPEAADLYAAAVVGPSTTNSIPEATHGLTTRSIIPMIYENTSGTVYERIIPDEFTIDTNADISIEFASTPDNDLYVVLVDTATSVSGTTSSFSNETTVTIEDAESRFMHVACYLEDTANDKYYMVMPDSVTYDAANNAHEIVFSHTDDALSYVIVYCYGSIQSNVLSFTTTTSLVSGDITDVTACNLAIYGISQSLLPVKTFANYLDSYLKDDQSIIAADGLMYRNTDPSISDAYDGRSRVASSLVIGPTFYATNPTETRRRTEGYIVASNTTAAGYVEVSAVEYVTASGYTRYTLSIPSYACYTGSGVSCLITALIDTDRDKLTVTGMMNSRFNGTFDIQSVAIVDSDTVTIDVDNSSVDKAIWDDADAAGRAGIFTDQIEFATAFTAVSGDSLNLSDELSVSVSGRLSTTVIYVTDVEEIFRLNAGLNIGVTTTTEEYPLVTTSLLPGDTVEVGDVTTQISAVDATSVTFRDDIDITDGRLTITVPYRWEIIPPADSNLGEDLLSRTDIIRSVAGKGSLYLSQGIKYDGEKIYRSGIPKIQSQLFITVEEDSAGISVDTAVSEIASLSSEVLTFAATADVDKFSSGQEVLIKKVPISGSTTIDNSDVYTITAIDTTGNTITLDRAPGTIVGTWSLCTFEEYDYFLRLTVLDRNNNLIVGPSTGGGDLKVRLATVSKVHIRGTCPADTAENLDYDNMNLEVFRRQGAQQEYKKIYTLPISDGAGAYFDITDTTSELTITGADFDKIGDPVSGGIGETRSGPMTAGFVTAINNQLVYGDLTGENKLELSFSGNPEDTDLHDTEWTLTTSSGDTVYKVSGSGDSEAVTASTQVAGTSFTVTIDIAQGDLAAGDWIYIANSEPDSVEAAATLLGWWQITSLNEIAGPKTEITVNWTGTPTLATADTADLVVYYDTDGKIPLGEDIEYYNMGASTRTSIDAVKNMFPYHLASAINATQRSTGVYARAGGDYTLGFLQIAGAELTSITLPDTLPCTMFGNGATVTDGADVTARQLSYGSRLIFSLPGYPEVFQDNEIDVGIDLPTVQDVNPDDGEDLVIAVPFFATAAFGSAQQSNVLVAFKPHSIYIIDSQAKLEGNPDYFKKLETKGLGCEAPGSVVNTAEGIFFANSSGIYLLDRTFTVRYVGKNVENFWEKTLLDKPNISKACGSNYLQERKYRLSVPVQDGDNYTNAVLNYKIPEEGIEVAGEMMPGGAGWTRYDNFNAVTWANRGVNTYFITDRGFVGKLRNDGNLTDYADNGDAVECEITFRAMDFGYPSTRKYVKYITMFISSDVDRESGDVAVSMSTDFSSTFNSLDNYTLSGREDQSLTGIGDLARNYIDRVSFSPYKSARLTWIQIKVTTSGGVDKDFTVHRILYKVGLTRGRAEAVAAQTPTIS